MKSYCDTCKLLIVFIFPVLVAGKLTAQPYLDIVNLKYSCSHDAGLFNQNKNKTRLGFLNVSTNLPIQFNNKKDAVIFSPFFEKWSARINNNSNENYYSIGLPVSLSKTIQHSRWNFLLTGIIRMNDSSINKNGKLQAGGATIFSYKKSEKIIYKFGIYINNELFGVFIMPLIGLNWKISKRDYLFGVLPGNLTYEHKITKLFYYGACFRAITNSYGKTKGYWRIDENQLGLYLDAYVKKNIIFNVEAGHSILRKIRKGIKDIYTYDSKVNDGLYFKACFAYRTRF